jgi:ATP-dependent Lhr-like helicase
MPLLRSYYGLGSIDWIELLFDEVSERSINNVLLKICMINNLPFYSSQIQSWFQKNDWKPFDFQVELWEEYRLGKSGLLNAPTGSGKTYAVWVPVIEQWIRSHPEDWQTREPGGIQVLWLTPLRALAKDTEHSLNRLNNDLGMSWSIVRRTGDTSSADKQKMDRKLPACLITTPESLHILLSRKNSARYFKNLKAVIVDEWHELLSSKRGTLTELGLSAIRAVKSDVQVWGVSATIGNLQQALEVLNPSGNNHPTALIVSKLEKKLQTRTILPDKVESFSWAGHIGVRLIPKIIPIIESSKTTLLFTNTRAQAEIWYQQLLDAHPEFAGQIALHHGSLDPDIRTWVEDAIHSGKLKVVVSTSSLDLGVDFSPVETVIQVGSPKGVARFLQRAGRSGHQPGATSRIYFIPTHAMEIIESAALQTAIRNKYMEERIPYQKPLDVLVQYIATRATGDGFQSEELFREVTSTHAYASLSKAEWDWALQFLTSGGDALKSYNDFAKVTRDEDGFFVLQDKRKAMRHRLSIGTITADPHLKVKFISGGTIGTVEESFISRLTPGDTLLFAGRWLDYVRTKDMTVYVRKSKKNKGAVSRWMGGRMQLSTQLSEMIRLKMDEANRGVADSEEMKAVWPLLELQKSRSALPSLNQLLIEKFKSREGWHLCFYPIEGRMVHEGLATLMSYRISRIQPISFTMAMNDYGFELLSAEEPPLEKALLMGLLSVDSLDEDIAGSINASEMGKRHFREISRIAGLVFQGFPGNKSGAMHLQASSELLYEVFSKYDENNLLLEQTRSEIMTYQLEIGRIKSVLERFSEQEIIIKEPEKATPFAFPIMVDRLRAKLTSEKLEDRIKRMRLQLEK